MYIGQQKRGGFSVHSRHLFYTRLTHFFLSFFFFLGIGNFVGPFIFLEREHPKYGTGFAITWITAAISGLLAIAYRYECIRDNRARNASGCREAFDHAFEDPTDKAVSSSSNSAHFFFFARGLIRMLTTYVLFFAGGNYRINNFDISYKKGKFNPCFFNEKFIKQMKKGKITRKNTSTHLPKKEKCSVLYLFFSSLFFSFSLFPFFLLSNPVLLVLLVLNFVFASTPCPRGRKGEGGRFVCKV